MQLYGIDFTSAPRRAKPITVAGGRLENGGLRLETLETLPDWPAFEAFLRRPGPWLGGFDFPFGLPREAVRDLAWPEDWAALVTHCRALGKEAFRAALDAHRQGRPAGRRYAHRATDRVARSHSPLKLVNPPVGLMFLQGAPRLLDAGLDLPGLHAGDHSRRALEIYPGWLARQITRAPYKSDQARKQTAARSLARAGIHAALGSGHHPLGMALHSDDALGRRLVEDGSGDSLDAALALVLTAAAWRAGAPGFGLPADIDAVEGWIAGLPAVQAC